MGREAYRVLGCEVYGPVYYDVYCGLWFSMKYILSVMKCMKSFTKTE